MGRPTDNPKAHQINVRLDDESFVTLEKYCKQEKIQRAEGVRRGIAKLKDDIKK